MEGSRTRHGANQDTNSIHVIDFMGWITGDAKRPGRPRTIFGDGGKRPPGRKTLIGRRRLQEQYETRRVTGFNSDEIADIRQIFEYYDLDNNKTMDLSELDVALRALGYNPSVDDVEEMTSLMDVDGDKTLDFSEFCMILEHMREIKGEFGELRDAFRCLDHNEDGHIATEDLTRLLTTHGESVSLKEAHNIIKLADPQETGHINYDRFIDILRAGKTLPSPEEGPSTSQSFDVSSTAGWTPSTSTQSSLTSLRSNKTKKKKKIQLDIIGGEMRRIEPIDSITKALGGPILLTSAIIITAQPGSRPQSTRKRRRWPSLHRILNYKTRMAKQEIIEETSLENISEDENENSDLISQSSDCHVIDETAT